MTNDSREMMVKLGLAKSIPEMIGEVIASCIDVVLLGWSLVSFFPVTWGQALIISWMFNKLLGVLRTIGE